ncbi:hypothetical protein BKA70DRAFT_1261520 [Coprinopsis sp. MPI-PUGE-AT-0042]|nr:hypothetical protein BKA70DRAFT_1261520 [Coprinopsis sp. MPI-PUGE-AT-0042]
MSHQGFFQLGGWRGDIQSIQKETWDDRGFAESLMDERSPLRLSNPRGPLELVLGIKPTGASYLLLTEDQARAWTSAYRRPLPNRSRKTYPDSYSSLSPISFASVEQLKAKLSSLKPKKGGDYDTSQANKGYLPGQDGSPRARFEHSRVFWKILQETLADPAKYNVPDSATRLPRDLRICSLTFTLRALDERSVTARRATTTILDLGWAEADVPRLEFKPGTGFHYVLATNSMYSQGRGTSREDFAYGETEVMPNEEALGAKVRGLLSPLNPQKPTVLLVVDRTWTADVLRYLRVSYQTKPLKDLIWDNTPASSNRGHDQDYNSGHYDRNNQRRRSRSPPRHHNGASASPSSSSAPPRDPRRRASPPAQRPDGPAVYLVDVKELYLTMSTDNDSIQRRMLIHDLAARLGVPVEAGKWNAGNEAVLLFELWKRMASGSPVDEQRLETRETRNNAMNVYKIPEAEDESDDGEDSDEGNAADGAVVGNEDEDDDDDPNNYDPNDYPAGSTEGSAQTAGPSIEPDEFSDYGSDD